MNSLPESLKSLRANRGVSQQQVAKAIQVSKSLITSFESGRLIPKPDTAERLDRYFDCGNRIRKLAGEARERARRRPATQFRSWIEHERRATALRIYQPLVIPGLFQTEAYARMVLSCGGVPASEVERRLRIRLDRQEILKRETPPRINAIIDEMVLRRGDRTILLEQLEHLAELARQPNVTIRVVPLDAPAHLGWGGPMTIASFDDGGDIGNLDNHVDGTMITDPDKMTALLAAWDDVCAVALNARQSLELIEDVIKKWPK